VERLPPERVKVVRRRARIEDPDVALCGELKEALEPRARMLRAATLIAMGKEEGQSRRLSPLGKARDDELVDDDLRPVDEIAELCLPAHQRL
jgi:hypothetical protein